MSSIAPAPPRRRDRDRTRGHPGTSRPNPLADLSLRPAIFNALGRAVKWQYSGGGTAGISCTGGAASWHEQVTGTEWVLRRSQRSPGTHHLHGGPCDRHRRPITLPRSRRAFHVSEEEGDGAGGEIGHDPLQILGWTWFWPIVARGHDEGSAPH